MKRGRTPIRLVTIAAGVAMLTGCLHFNVRHLSSDAFNGRDNNSPGGIAARQYVLDMLDLHADGLIPGKTGDAAFLQTFPQGTNVLGVIRGTKRPNDYVVIGAHYDHHEVCGWIQGDEICNGATDNATGAALVLEMAARFAANPPDRSVVFALWDAEEDGLLGSTYFVDNPVVPLDRIVSYLNLDIQGANLLPSIRSTTFAIGAESGGSTLEGIVQDSYDQSTLDGRRLSAIFGMYRSDYAPFLMRQVPTVFFTDSTGPCYHTPDDEAEIVDFAKLDQQADVLHRTASALAYDLPDYPGTFVRPRWETRPAATYADAASLLDVMELTLEDLHRFPEDLQEEARVHREILAGIVAEGPGRFGDDDMAPVLMAASMSVNLLTYGDCESFVD